MTAIDFSLPPIVFSVELAFLLWNQYPQRQKILILREEEFWHLLNVFYLLIFVIVLFIYLIFLCFYVFSFFVLDFLTCASVFLCEQKQALCLLQMSCV